MLSVLALKKKNCLFLALLPAQRWNNNTPHSSFVCSDSAHFTLLPTFIINVYLMGDLHMTWVNWMCVQTTMNPFIRHVTGWCMVVTVRTSAQFHTLLLTTNNTEPYCCDIVSVSLLSSLLLYVSLPLSLVSYMTFKPHY